METIGDRIQARIDEMGISQAELSRRCGISQSGMNFIITGKIKKPTGLDVIADALHVSVDWLMGRSEQPPSQIIRIHDSEKKPMGRPKASIKSSFIPIKATAAGDLKAGKKMPSKNIGKIQWPPQFQSMEGVYAVYVSGNSMAPAFNNKDLALISPHLPYGKGDIVVFVENQSEFVGKEMSIKTYIGEEGDKTVFQQLYPLNRIEIPTTNIQYIHKVLSHREITSG